MMRYLLLMPILAAVLVSHLQAANTTLVPAVTTFKYIKGTNEASVPSTAWRSPVFNDSSWLTGTTSIGYGESDGLTTTTDIGPANSVPNYLSVYMRKTFNVPNPSAFTEVTGVLRVDDGAVVYLNGVEMGRVNVPAGELTFDDAAVAALELSPLTFSTNGTALIAGNNVLAVHVFNANLTSSDLLMDIVVTGTIDDVAPTIANVNPPPTAVVRTLTQIDIVFSELVTNVDAADLRINGNPASNLSFGAPGQFIFSFAEPPVGPVLVEWASGHGITDLAPVPNAFAGVSFTYTLDPNAAEAGIIITEFMADNDNTLNDEDGDNSDWIELHNASGIAGNLDGWFLTDDRLDLTKWRIPNVTLLPNDYIVIFASGKNKINTSGRLHTIFSLRNEGEYLALVNPQTNVVSFFEPIAQQEDVSYGRDRANPSVLGFFVVPTPGAPNSATGAGFAPEVQFSRKGGTFVNAFSLVLNTTSSNAVIRYTTTTNMPTASSPIYSGPIPINATMQIRARAFEPGLIAGPPRTEHFVRLDPNVVGFSSDLPLMILHNFGGGAVPATGEQYVMMQIFETHGARSSLTNAPDLETRGRFRLRGSSTQGYAKGSFAFESWDEFDDDTNISPLGLPPESDWVLYAPNNFEPALIHNPLAYKLSNLVGRYASRTRFVEVYLKDEAGAPGSVVAADYNGVYVLEERVKVDDNRVDIDRLEAENLSGLALTGGYLLSVDRPFAGAGQFTAAGQTMNFVDPNGEVIRLPQRDAQEQYVINYLNQFFAALNAANYRDPTNGYAKYVDVEAAIDHHIINVLTFNVDALRLSGYFSKTRDTINDRGELVPGKLVFGPVWDFDRTQGSTDGRDLNPLVWRSEVPDLGTDFFNYPWWGRMFSDTNFWQLWIDRWQMFRTNELSTNTIFMVVDGMANEVREAQVREQARWNILPRQGLVPGNSATGYQAEIEFKKYWYRRRIDFIDGQFLRAPTLSHGGGQVSAGFMVSISGPPGATIYYTLDGTDPRGSQGVIAPTALLYSGPITINVNARVVARSRNLAHMNLTGANRPPVSSPWSGPVAATFIVQTPQLVVTEIMYNPRGAIAGNTNDADNFEYIELKNVGATTLNLVGVEITNGIQFTFTAASAVTSLAPGARVILVNNQAAYLSRYGSLANVGGEYLGSLNNGGDRLTVIGRLREPILDFSYDDDWYPVTDGVGFSLVIVNELAPLNTWGLPTSWRISAAVHGSPGNNDPAASSFPGIVINEALTHTDIPVVDAIEVHNPTAAPVNIGGWFLSDSSNNPLKYRIPDNTVVVAGGYLVFYESNSFNATPGAPNNFAFNSKGDALYIFSGNGTELTGHGHGFDFGAAPNGVTFGRHVISTGTDQFPLQSTSTLGAANSGPRIGPVVITEINYHPVDLVGGLDNSQDEYIELHNITGSPVPLFDTLRPSNTWHLGEAVDFGFPQGATIAAGGYILVVNFNPTNTTSLNEFRIRNGVSASVPVFGPFQGQLDNSSEAVELLAPDNPEVFPAPDAGFVPYYLIERVRYSDQSPWAVAADGLGPSLQRVTASTYGNDPINWLAAGRSPGGPYAGGIAPVISLQPASQTIVAGQNVSLTVNVSQGGPVNYQWRFNGATLAGATSPTLALSNVQPAQAGQYQVIVLNAAAAVASSNATLVVLIPARIALHPMSLDVRAGTNVSLSVSATSTSPITYQWRKNGIPLNGATSPVLSLFNVQPPDDAIYDVVVTDAVGPVVSLPARLFVLVDPTIVVQPVPSTNAIGSSYTLSVEVTNTATLPISFRWRRSGTTLAAYTVNARTAFYTITNLQASNVYSVIITNKASYRPGVFSPSVIVNVVASIPDMDGDGLPDSYEMAHGLNKNNAADATMDSDGDGVSNRDEYISGTDPQSAASYLKIVSITHSDQVQIEFRAANNRTYSVLYRDDATAGSWSVLGGAPALSSTDETTRSVTVADPQPPQLAERFYKLVSPAMTGP